MKRILLLLCVALSAIAWAQSASPRGAPAVLVANGAFFALSVADLDASVHWYTEKLGLQVVMRPPKLEKSTVVVLEGGGLIVELIRHDDSKPLSEVAPAVQEPLHVQGIFKVGVIVEDFDATLAKLRERDVRIAFGPYPARDGQRANAIVEDNAGNLIQLFGKERP